MRDAIERRNARIRARYADLIKSGKKRGEAIDTLVSECDAYACLSFDTILRIVTCNGPYGDGKIVGKDIAKV